MEVKEYISSGFLESFAAGQLSEIEAAGAEDLIKKHPEIRSEYEKIQKALYLISAADIKTPDNKVKENIMNRIKVHDNKIHKAENLFDYHSSSSRYKYFLAAAVVFLVLSLTANLILINRLSDAKKESAVLSDQKKIIVQEYEAVNRKLNLATSDMEIMKNKNYKMTELTGLEKSPGSNVITFWNPETKKLYAGVMSLPVPPPDKQYQLWAISNGTPVDAGVMDVDPSDKSLHEMKSTDDAQAFAVTLEPKGGSIKPTMNQMYVLGKI